MKSLNSLRAFLFLLSLTFTSSLLAQALPNLKLMGSDGKEHKIHDYVGNGKWTVVVVWGPKCPACTAEMPSIQGIYDDRETTNINVLGLVLDYPTFGYAKLKQVQTFEEDYFISFPSLLISSAIYFDLDIGMLRGTPTLILVDPEGEVSAVQLGAVPRKTIEQHIAKYNAKKQ